MDFASSSGSSTTLSVASCAHHQDISRQSMYYEKTRGAFTNLKQTPTDFRKEAAAFADGNAVDTPLVRARHDREVREVGVSNQKPTL
jgi:hypothetical protein